MSVRADDPDFEHALKNYIAIVLGYANLLLDEMPADDHRRADVLEIHNAAEAAAALFGRDETTT